MLHFWTLGSGQARLLPRFGLVWFRTGAECWPRGLLGELAGPRALLAPRHSICAICSAPTDQVGGDVVTLEPADRLKPRETAQQTE